ncbi:hypothetical protein CPC08DRAFT_376057 [Agrocybe pediades]|nr:hypothetical protein CPC08DRAFT_376057 [Agrocybe pediades]
MITFSMLFATERWVGICLYCLMSCAETMTKLQYSTSSLSTISSITLKAGIPPSYQHPSYSHSLRSSWLHAF